MLIKIADYQQLLVACLLAFTIALFLCVYDVFGFMELFVLIAPRKTGEK